MLHREDIVHHLFEGHIATVFERIFVKRGGIGLSSALRSNVPAYLGSIALTASVIHNAFLQLGLDDAESAVSDLRILAADMETQYRDFVHLNENLDDPFPIFLNGKSRKGIQRQLNRAVRRAVEANTKEQMMGQAQHDYSQYMYVLTCCKQ
jgi:hypothetical protein